MTLKERKIMVEYIRQNQWYSIEWYSKRSDNQILSLYYKVRNGNIGKIKNTQKHNKLQMSSLF